MRFETIKNDGQARRGRLIFSRGNVQTPAFMPVGTYGTVKGVLPRDLQTMGAQIILGNTFHLWMRPGLDVLQTFGGLHRFEGCLTVGHVELKRQNPVAEAFHEAVEAGEIPDSGRYPISALQRGFCPYPAETAGGSGDEPGFHYLPPSSSSRRDTGREPRSVDADFVLAASSADESG